MSLFYFLAPFLVCFNFSFNFKGFFSFDPFSFSFVFQKQSSDIGTCAILKVEIYLILKPKSVLLNQCRSKHVTNR